MLTTPERVQLVGITEWRQRKQKRKSHHERLIHELGAGDPETYPDAQRDLALSHRHELAPKDKSLAIIREQYAREISGLAASNKERRAKAARSAKVQPSHPSGRSFT